MQHQPSGSAESPHCKNLITTESTEEYLPALVCDIPVPGILFWKLPVTEDWKTLAHVST